MTERPLLEQTLNSTIFREYYYLKEELVDFCRKNGLPASGGKAELTERIAYFLDTGRVLPVQQTRQKPKVQISFIDEDTVIEANFVCTEVHRAFFKKQIGNSFSFNVPFQKWLKSNAGKTYKDAVLAYQQILARKKKEPSTIGRQFEYNTYIRDFFSDNHDKSLDDAIKCWKHKKRLPGHNRYERSDLSALE